jgi:pimeloyl-ACP methyl ester carboxylesterase
MARGHPPAELRFKDAIVLGSWVVASLLIATPSCQGASPHPAAPPIRPRASASCAPTSAPVAPPSALPSSSASEQDASASHVEPVLGADSPWLDLPIAGHEPAVVSLPMGARGKVPVVVAAQGLGENPRWWCEWWRDRVGDRGFVLCPRGRFWGRLASGDAGYSYRSVDELEDEVARGLEALAARFPAHVDPGPVLFVGFSLGATMGAALIARHPARLPRAILVEGGNTDWNDRRAKAFASEGGQRILFGCGTEGCLRWARFSKRRLDRAGVETRIAHGEGGGHAYHDGPVSAALCEAFDWVLQGDARWFIPE